MLVCITLLLQHNDVKSHPFQIIRKEKKMSYGFSKKINSSNEKEECFRLIDEQLKKDSNNFQVVNLVSEKINIIIRKKQTHLDLARFLHAACFSPVPSTFIKAIKNNHFSTWPGLTSELITKHLPMSIATAKGHLNQERQNIQSTKTPSTDFKVTLQRIKQNVKKLKNQISKNAKYDEASQDNILLDSFPLSDSPNKKTNEAIFGIYSSKDVGVGYTDLTGRFPYQSTRGNNYIFVAYHYDANAILVEPIKNRKALTIVIAWEKINNKLKIAGLQPTTYIMDNEFSDDMKIALRKEKIQHQLVPPNCHRANAAERAIQTFKNHFKAGLATLDPDFPVKEWDRLLPQAELTLNLL